MNFLRDQIDQIEVDYRKKRVALAKIRFPEYELRTTHSASDDQLKVLLVPPGTAQIYHISNVSSAVYVILSMGKKIELPSDWGYGATEEDAWFNLSYVTL